MQNAAYREFCQRNASIPTQKDRRIKIRDEEAINQKRKMPGQRGGRFGEGKHKTIKNVQNHFFEAGRDCIFWRFSVLISP